MKHALQKLLIHIEKEPTLGRQFYEKTKILKLNVQTARNKIVKEWTKIHFKTYPRLRGFTVDKKLKKQTSLTKLLHKRSSVRDFSGESMSFDDFFSLMHNAVGITKKGQSFDESRRAYPSAGARYPLELYAVAIHVSDFKPGLYHYNVKEDLVELLLKGDVVNEIDEIFGQEPWIKKASVVLFITAVPERTTRKYGDRGYRFIFMETGIVSQNISLLAKESGYGSCLVGGFIEDKVISLLDIQLQEELPLVGIVIGKPDTMS